MLRAVVSLSVSLLLAVALGTAPAVARGGHPPMMLGPGDAKVHNIKDKALVRMSKWGFVYIAGQQNSHLTITYLKKSDSLRYRDTGTRHLGKLAKPCHRIRAKKGVAVQCKIPPRFRKKMFVQVWPRLGNDYVDARSLPHKLRLWALVDAGRDTVLGGAGNDFVNGAKDGDHVMGGPGNDFLRTGPGNDRVKGGPGKDRLSCAENYDTAIRDRRDSLYQCERVLRG